MTTITVNNQRIVKQNENYSTINELMDQLLEKHLSNQEVITGISINGKMLAIEEENRFMPQDINLFEQIDFKVQSTLDLAFEALNSCSGYIDVVTEKIHELVAIYQSNQIEEAHHKFGDVIEVVDLFVQLITKIHRTLKTQIGPDYKKSSQIQNLEIHLLSIMKGLLPAKEKNDWIMLCDLLEYELIDNLTQWKIKAIPELKNYQSKSL